MSTVDISLLSWTADLYESQNAAHVITSLLNFGRTNFGKQVLACDTASPNNDDSLGGLRSLKQVVVLELAIDLIDFSILAYQHSMIRAVIVPASSISPSMYFIHFAEGYNFLIKSG